MIKKQSVLIIGEHPIKNSIIGQYVSIGYEVTQDSVYNEDSLWNEWTDIVILSAKGDHSTLDDASSVRIIEQIGIRLRDAKHVRPRVHVLLQSPQSAALLNHREYKDDWHGLFELHAFTLNEVWARNILCSCSAGYEKCALDYRPISFDSDQVVHLVVCGVSNLTTVLVENAALVAHFPNYIRNHSLRTRITVIDNRADEWGRSFVCQHRALMDNSFYRFVNVPERKSELHKPMYDGKREDFVDVEWEFVSGSLFDVVVQDKLRGWATDNGQLLSIAICHDDDEQNLSLMNNVVDLLSGLDVPVYVKQSSSAFSEIIGQSPRMHSVRLIGMEDSGYDVTLPLLTMAKRVKYVYDYCYENNIVADSNGCITAPSVMNENEVEEHWLLEKRAIKRYSCMSNAMTLATKMRSIGHDHTRLNTFYAITREEIDLIAKVEHNRWCVEEMLLGFRPCSDEEQLEVEENIAKKSEFKDRLVHYDLRAYNDLRADETGKNVDTYDICLSASIPLIAYEEKGGDR